MITDVEELPDGQFNIMLRGLVKFRVTGEDQSRPYRLALVDAIPVTSAFQWVVVSLATFQASFESSLRAFRSGFGLGYN